MGNFSSVKLIKAEQNENKTSFILASGVWWAETTGARQYAALVGPRIIDDVNPVSGGSNVTHTTGTTGTGSLTVGIGLGGNKSCPPNFPCASGEKCCSYNHKTGCQY